MGHRTSAIYAAPAKLNLFLHVIGRRADGYHELQTVFRFIDCCDRLAFHVRADGVIARPIDVPGVPERQDLVIKAATLLQSFSGTRLGADILIEKVLPLGGGLGGGSSDAATTLIALNQLWDTKLNRAQLQALALKLGADVPVFVFGRNAFAEGIGERLQAIDLAPAWYLVLVPDAHVSTATVYAQSDLTRSTDPIKIAAFSTGWGRNDLTSVVRRLQPEVGKCLDWLSQFGDARMTGSGACVFCAFDSEAAAQAVLAKVPHGVSGFVARGLDEHPLRSLVRDE